MTSLSDTLVALATPMGTSALGVLRVSGPRSGEIFRDLFRKTAHPRQAQHVRWHRHEGGWRDDGIAVFYAGPSSFTGEDSFEYTGHGNPLLLQTLVHDLLERGCRMAEPGEFTRRAFTHGKLDLSQAEAIIDLIHARSERALVVANQQLNGSLRRHIDTLTGLLLEALARVEAYIDFPEEDLPAEDRDLLRDLVSRLDVGVKRLLATEPYGQVLREGLRTVILGEPNAGKSSLLNRLVGHDRALVSPEPGTTRDFIEERLLVGGHCLRLIDTAGLNAAPGAVEKLGIDKTLERAAEADLVLLVIDGSVAHPTLPNPMMEAVGQARTLVVLNKADLGVHPEATTPLAGTPYLSLSAETGMGIDALVRAIQEKADGLALHVGDDALAINARHADALRRAKVSLDGAREHLALQGPTELLASDLRGALDALGEIGGRVDNERMLDALFKTFCIGK